jgi:hypothetical protein
MIIQIDSREQKNEHVRDYFDSVDQQWFTSKCYTGDYYDFTNPRVCIDLKQSHGDGIAELCANLTIGHERLVNEVTRAKEVGFKKFYFLIVSTKITRLEDVHKWVNKRGKVKPETLQKIMVSFRKNHNVNYVFCKKKKAGQEIIRLLGGQE